MERGLIRGTRGGERGGLVADGAGAAKERRPRGAGEGSRKSCWKKPSPRGGAYSFSNVCVSHPPHYVIGENWPLVEAGIFHLLRRLAGRGSTGGRKTQSPKFFSPGGRKIPAGTAQTCTDRWFIIIRIYCRSGSKALAAARLWDSLSREQGVTGCVHDA